MGLHTLNTSLASRWEGAQSILLVIGRWIVADRHSLSSRLVEQGPWLKPAYRFRQKPETGRDHARHGWCCPPDYPICGYGLYEGYCFVEDSSITTTTTTTVSSCRSEQLYGEHSEETEALRYIRDNVLSQSPEGQEIIRLYYEWNPAIVQAMEDDEEFKQDVKEMVDGVLEMID